MSVDTHIARKRLQDYDDAMVVLGRIQNAAKEARSITRLLITAGPFEVEIPHGQFREAIASVLDERAGEVEASAKQSLSEAIELLGGGG